MGARDACASARASVGKTNVAEQDEARMAEAVAAAATVRARTTPNPWVGAVLVTPDGASFAGATEPPGARHAEIVAIDGAREVADTVCSTLYTTLEPCCHQGRTGACTEVIIRAGITRVVAGIEDPDPQVAGNGTARLRAAGI